MFSTVRDYSVPLLLALSLHAVVGLGLYRGWNPESSEKRVIKPRAITTSLIVREQRKKTKPAASKPQPVRPKPVTPKTPPPQPAPVAKPEPPKPEVDPEAERRRQEKALRDQRLAQMRETAFEQALADELEDLTGDETAQEALTYAEGIYALVVSNWSRPPSARNDMSATINVELFPSGELNSVSLVESSGHAAFDRSALAAVRKARRFEVPQDTALFERQFRSFTLLFKPEDLLR